EASYPELVEEAIGFAKPGALEKGISFFSEIKVEESVFIDEQRIFQVLSNLISNALKFTPQGGRVSLKAFVEGDRLVSEVSDDGIGIAPEDLGKLFNRFTQLDMGLTRSTGGTIGVSSQGPGKGATFRFELPLS
ncbi:MAG TPA: HAMP domain-containing sensor histidine kinase, partial [Chroococcales cyanobacterium]